MSHQAHFFDIVIFGATGFTGAEIAKFIDAQCKSGEWAPTWAVAGRSRAKLDALVAGSGLKPSGVIVADTSSPSSLEAMAADCRLVLNCTGPYRFYGEAVVKACIEAGTDYIDLCGEPEFIDRCMLTHHEAAEAAESLVVHACAFDSVPADIGIMFAAQQFAPPARCAAVEVFHTFTSPAGVGGAHAHATTFEAAVHGFGAVKETRAQRKRLLAKHEHLIPPPLLGPKLKTRPGPDWNKSVGAFALRFPGSDAAVIKASQLALAQCGAEAGRLAPQYAVYFCIRTRLWVLVGSLLGAAFGFLSSRPWGRDLLLKYPGFFTAGLFSEAGPSRAMLEGSGFRTELLAMGYAEGSVGADAKPFGKPDVAVRCSVSGPEPGYIATSAMFAAVARTLLEQRKKLLHRGGVFTPGGVFGSSGAEVVTALVERLGANGVVFAVDKLPHPV